MLINLQLAGLEFFQAVDATDQGRLARATGTDNHHHFTVCDGEVNVFENMVLTEVFVQALHAHDLFHGSVSVRLRPVRVVLRSAEAATA